MIRVDLPSGAVLQITPAPFKDARALYQALLKEARSIAVHAELDLTSLYKDLFCVGFSSPEIEKVTWKCLERCIYNDLRITEDTFEPIEARGDYLKVIMEVVKANVTPFANGLSADFSGMYQTILGTIQK